MEAFGKHAERDGVVTLFSLITHNIAYAGYHTGGCASAVLFYDVRRYSYLGVGIRFRHASVFWRRRDGTYRCSATCKSLICYPLTMKLILLGKHECRRNSATGVFGRILTISQNIRVYDINENKWFVETATGDVPSPRRGSCAGVAWADDRSSYNM